MKQSVLLCTGGIGSGKSFVVSVFNALGVPSYDCDSAAKELYDTDPDLLASVAEVAGRDIVVDGRLDRKMLAERIFSDPTLLSKVESLVHPAVIRDFVEWRSRQPEGIVIIESAIMLEHPELMSVVDKVAVVTAPMDLRIARVVERDECAEEDVLARMERQWSDSRRAEAADWIIENDEIHALLPQILNILEKNEITDYGKD